MKKLILFSLMAVSLTLAACGSDKPTNTEADNSSDLNEQNEVDVKKESEFPFPDNTEQLGEASVVVSTSGGDSQDGNVPVLFVNEDTLMDSVWVEYANFQGDKETFIYINGIYDNTDQIGELTQTTIELVEGNLEPGIYTVSAVQFEKNNPESKPIVYTEAQFEIKKANE